MTRNNFFKRLGAFAAVALLSPLELLKGKSDVYKVTGDVVIHNPPVELPKFNPDDANKFQVSDGYGNIEWGNQEEFYALNPLRQYPLTEEECFYDTLILCDMNGNPVTNA